MYGRQLQVVPSGEAEGMQKKQTEQGQLDQNIPPPSGREFQCLGRGQGGGCDNLSGLRDAAG